MQNGNVIVIVLVGALLTSELKEGQRMDHTPETHYGTTTKPIAAYGFSGTSSGSADIGKQIPKVGSA